MARITLAFSIVAVLAGATAGCGGDSQQPASGDSAPATSAYAPGQAQPQLNISFKSETEPPKAGQNTFEAMILANGQPVTDADVTADFHMAAMPSMNMPEMRNSMPLKHEGDGRYRGSGNVMMAGGWEVTVTVKRGGQVVGSEKFTVTAQ